MWIETTRPMYERDGAPAVFASIGRHFPALQYVFADGAYRGTKLGRALELPGKWTIESVTRVDDTRGFEIPPRNGSSRELLHGSSCAGWQVLE